MPESNPPSTDRPPLGITRGPHFRLVADSTYDWETWFSPSGKPLWVNPAVERMTGYTVAECLAMPAYPLPMVLPDDAHRFRGLWDDMLAMRSGNDVEFRVRRRDDSILWVAVSWQPMTDGESHLGFRTSIRDVSRNRALKEQLRLHAEQLESLVEQRSRRLRELERTQTQMEKMAALGHLAASVAHEINNPLAGIRNALTLIREDRRTSREHHRLFLMVDREIERMSNIVRQLYQVHRRRPAAVSRFDLAALIEEVLYFLDSVAGSRQVRIEHPGETDTILVELPEDEVKQVVYNLVSNAIQASPPGQTVTVGMGRTDCGYRIDVTDRGAGIAGDQLRSIFEPFFSTKGNDPSGAVGMGLGLGLSLSKALLESIGGQIKVETAPGRGSRFTAILPREVRSR